MVRNAKKRPVTTYKINKRLGYMNFRMDISISTCKITKNVNLRIFIVKIRVFSKREIDAYKNIYTYWNFLIHSLLIHFPFKYKINILLGFLPPECTFFEFLLPAEHIFFDSHILKQKNISFATMPTSYMHTQYRRKFRFLCLNSSSILGKQKCDFKSKCFY